ncbi:hypothetical protein TrLO_g8642 [Triparma laevis f. longispina]|uniref:Protein-serine/threonine kinase n=1 Tax=Triparma laevis f. longispina TaxID=1714387 RepID=A0A9W7AVZ4_9STRA|nr:hypothetical protein TrLO_g8642 [Triparma laevis f. longispina]
MMLNVSVPRASARVLSLAIRGSGSYFSNIANYPLSSNPTPRNIVGSSPLLSSLRPSLRSIHNPLLISTLSRGMSSKTTSKTMKEMVTDYSSKPQTPVSLQTLMETGRGERIGKGGTTDATIAASDSEGTATELVLMQVASFLKHELPIRLAHRIKDLDNVPMMSEMNSVLQVRDWYEKSMTELIEFPAITSKEDEEKFAKLLEGIYERHAGVLVTMARGAFELRAAIREGKYGRGGKADFEEMEGMHKFLDNFYMSRIGIRMLIGQYLSLRQPPMDGYVGMICQKTSPGKVVQQAVDDASFMCNRKYGDAPEVIVHGASDLTFSYVPTHIHYIMLELLKNSMRATVEHHGVDEDYPPIKVIIADGEKNEDVVIKISDEGGGIKRSHVSRIWSYLFTTADPAVQEGMVAFENVDHSIDSPLAGLGYGLPISRAYAKFWGGDLSVMSMEGYGTDVFLHLSRLGASKEPLP